MNYKQREIIFDFLKTLLKNGENGDFVNAYNDGKQFIYEIAETDDKLKKGCVEIGNDFESE